MNYGNILRSIVRRGARMPIVVGTMLLAGLILGVQRGPGSADNIVIKDVKGQKRIELGIFDDKPAILMYDNKGRQCIRLAIQIEEDDNVLAGLQFFQSQNKAYAAELFAGDSGGKQSSGLRLNGPMDAGIALEFPGPEPRVDLRGGKPGGKSSLSLSVPAGAPRISMSDKRSKERLCMRLIHDGSAELCCQDEAETVIWKAPPETEGSFSSKPRKAKQEKPRE